MRTLFSSSCSQGVVIRIQATPLALLPSHQPILVHVGIRDLRDRWGLSTAEASELLLELLLERDPGRLFVPAFTYSFTKSREYSRAGSPSEVGGFSEHVRTSKEASLRTLDPVFSCVDVLDTGFSRGEINHDVFGERSLWHLWDNLDGLIVNIGLPKLISTQVHYIETRFGVPYRYNKVFPGRVVDETAGTSTEVDYHYNVRDLDEDPQWDRGRLRAMLEAAGVLHAFAWEGVEVMFMRARQLRQTLEPALAADPRVLLNHDPG